MDIPSIEKGYLDRKNRFIRLEDEGKHILKSNIDAAQIKINKYESRLKTIDSIIDKCKRKKIENPFTELNDIIGIRVVCLLLSDIPKIKDIIINSFDIIEEDNKINGSKIDTFGYMSLHFIVNLKEEYNGPRYDGLHGLNFEIQVRTIAMDAWANISHYLDYKGENDIPADLKRDFYALSGLFYVADKHFELFLKSKENKKKQLKDQFESEENNYNAEINVDSLEEYLSVNFPKRQNFDHKAVSELIDELYQIGYRYIYEIDDLVSKGWEVFELYEEEHPPNLEPGRKYGDIGVIRCLLSIMDQNYRKLMNDEDTYKRYRDLIE